jgi:GR25 family glycosyltransferase involved in LPS biosynthesis
MSSVDAVYVINLDRSTLRWKFMSEQCQRVGLPARRVPAVDGATLSREELRGSATRFCQNFCTTSMLGCALSHIATWKRILEEGHDRALVMEDDAELVPTFAAGLRQALEDVPDDFDILVLGCFYLCAKDRNYSWPMEIIRMFAPHGLRNDPRTWGSVFVPERFGGSHCYVVSKRGCQKLLEVIPKASYQIDMEMNHPSLNVYAVSPDLAFQRDMMESTVASFKFPKSLMPALGDVKDSKRISMAYYMDVPVGQVLGYKLNGWTLVFFVLGMLRHRAFPYVTGFLVAELAIGADVGVPVMAYGLGWGLRTSFGLVKM